MNITTNPREIEKFFKSLHSQFKGSYEEDLETFKRYILPLHVSREYLDTKKKPNLDGVIKAFPQQQQFILKADIFSGGYRDSAPITAAAKQAEELGEFFYKAQAEIAQAHDSSKNLVPEQIDSSIFDDSNFR